MLPTQTASGQLVRNAPNEAVLWSYTIQVRRCVGLLLLAAVNLYTPLQQLTRTCLL